jgi:transcriptional regulator GlxA family with amidase domain
MRRIVILALDGMQPLDVVGPAEVFSGARQAYERGAVGGGGARPAPYQVIIAGIAAGPVRAESGLRIVPDAALGRVVAGAGGRGGIDTFIVAGGAGARRAARDPRVVRLVRRAAGRARRVASVCTGSFVLAAAGLLDGRRATTHWAHCKELAALRPAVRVDPDPIYVHDGRIWTSAGVTAGIDLALAMVEDDLGPETANLVARHMVVFVRRAGGQSQFSAQLAAQAAERAPLRDLQAFIAEHPDGDLTVPALARRAGMSPRHFARVFAAETGVPPAAYVVEARLETARRLLESTGRNVEQVAAGAGFGTPEALRRAFARRMRLSPREYRARFGRSSTTSMTKEREHEDRLPGLRRHDLARRHRAARGAGAPPGRRGGVRGTGARAGAPGRRRPGAGS